MLNRRKKHVHSTQPVKEQRLLDKCKDWQGRKRIPKHMLQLKSTSYTQTLEIPIFRMSIYPTECDWHWNSRHSKSQPNLLVISLTVHFASDTHFSIRKHDDSSSVIVYGSSNQKNIQHFIALNICGNGWIHTQAASVQKMMFQKLWGLT